MEEKQSLYPSDHRGKVDHLRSLDVIKLDPPLVMALLHCHYIPCLKRGHINCNLTIISLYALMDCKLNILLIIE